MRAGFILEICLRSKDWRHYIEVTWNIIALFWKQRNPMSSLSFLLRSSHDQLLHMRVSLRCILNSMEGVKYQMPGIGV